MNSTLQTSAGELALLVLDRGQGSLNGWSQSVGDVADDGGSLGVADGGGVVGVGGCGVEIVFESAGSILHWEGTKETTREVVGGFLESLQK